MSKMATGYVVLHSERKKHEATANKAGKDRNAA
jgi:hypothetical protein